MIRQSLIGGGVSYVMTLAHKLDKNAVESFILSFTYGPRVDKLKSMGVQVFTIIVVGVVHRHAGIHEYGKCSTSFRA